MINNCHKKIFKLELRSSKQQKFRQNVSKMLVNINLVLKTDQKSSKTTKRSLFKLLHQNLQIFEILYKFVEKSAITVR